MKMKTGFTKAAPFLCALLACLQTVKGWSEPAFCHGCQCPQFKTLEKNEDFDFEERLYYPSHWLRIEIGGLDVRNLTDAFYKLDDYFQGKNEESLLFEETKPAAVTILDTEKGKKYFVSFFLPPGADLPKPNEECVTEESIPEGRMYVRVFGGTPSVQNWLDHLDKLKVDLTSAGKTYSHSRAMALGYDSMWTLFNRHDEIWIPAE